MKPLVLMLSLSAAVVLAQAPSSQRPRANPTKSSPAIEHRAGAALARMTGFLKTVKVFRVTAESSRDELVDTDMKVQSLRSSETTVRLPDRLHSRLRSDNRDLEFFYDGRALTVFSPEKKYYGVMPAPPTVSRTLDAAQARYGIVMPLTDFIQMAAGDEPLKDIIRAGYIGTTRIEGVECDHVAIRQRDVDWQVWIEKSETPLPRRLVITTKTEPTQPQYVATLSWDLSPWIDDSLFTFTPPPDAVRIAFGRMKNSSKTEEEP